jgi:Tfp pilus assembly protein PilF
MIRIDPRSSNAYSHRAAVYRKQGDEEKALRDERQAAELELNTDPELP